VAASLQGLLVVISGAATPVGRAVAVELSCQRARLVLADSEPPESLCAEVSAHAGSTRPVAVDASDPDSFQACLSPAKIGSVDCLVVADDLADIAGPFESSDPELWSRLVERNLLAPLLVLRSVLPGMLRAGRGQVVVVGDSLGRRSSPGHALRAATKWGMNGLTQALRSEIAARGIGVSWVEISDSRPVGDVDSPEPAVGSYLAGAARAVVMALLQPFEVGISELVLEGAP
jgi:NADP-dependent 3-hydroxy acid dehydrogenase YdfG